MLEKEAQEKHPLPGLAQGSPLCGRQLRSEPALQGSHLSHYRENNAPAAACEGLSEGTKNLRGRGALNNFLELVCGKW